MAGTRIPLLILLLLLLGATALTGVLSTTQLDTDDDFEGTDDDFDDFEGTDDFIVGGITDMENVGSNKLVQSLGKFAVETYNRNQLLLEKNKTTTTTTTLLSFSHVISAKCQLVEGIAYYLKIIAHHVEDSHHDAPKVFDAVIIEKPWLDSTELDSFTPSYLAS